MRVHVFQFLLNIDDLVHLNFAPKKLKQMLTEMKGLACPRASYHGLDLSAVMKFTSTVAVVTVVAQALVVPQKNILKDAAKALCGALLGLCGSSV